MVELLTEPWPWYIGGPLIGLTVPILLFMGGKKFGISSNLRHLCSVCGFDNINYFNYSWKKKGLWNLLFALGVVIGGFLAGYVFKNPEPVQISSQTVADLKALGINTFEGLVPRQVFTWSTLTQPLGFIVLVIGGFMVGFGTRYAGGCTSGHAITGLSDLQLGSLVAVIGFFVGGLIMTYLLLPLII